MADPASRTAGDRPRFHFTPATGWINDPLGLTHHDGRYHLFFQQVRQATRWRADQHWGHATSTDLLRWTEHTPVLSPGDGDDGVWSGSLVRDGAGRAVIFYTAVAGRDHHVGRVRVARPADPSWRTWTKGAVVAGLPADLSVVAFRDPFVLHDGSSWLMLVGAGTTDGTALALAYRSDDLTTWTYDGPLAARSARETTPVWTGAAWECPQLLRVQNRWILVVSVWEPGRPHDEAYAVGDLVAGRFVAESWHRLGYGGHYAGSAFTDAAARPGLVHWLRGIADPGGRWVGAHSLPHLLSVRGDAVVARPHPEILGRRVGTIEARGPTEVGPAVDVEWTVAPAAEARLSLSDDAGTVVDVISDGTTVTVRTGSTARIPVRGAVRMLVDGPVAEFFTDAGVLAVQTRTPGPDLTMTPQGAGEVRAHLLA